HGGLTSARPFGGTTAPLSSEALCRSRPRRGDTPMPEAPPLPPRHQLAPGLWQVADMERDGPPLDLDATAGAMLGYRDAGFDSFDMADHYGSAEDIAGRFLARAKARPSVSAGGT